MTLRSHVVNINNYAFNQLKLFVDLVFIYEWEKFLPFFLLISTDYDHKYKVGEFILTPKHACICIDYDIIGKSKYNRSSLVTVIRKYRNI